MHSFIRNASNNGIDLNAKTIQFHFINPKEPNKIVLFRWNFKFSGESKIYIISIGGAPTRNDHIEFETKNKKEKNANINAYGVRTDGRVLSSR